MIAFLKEKYKITDSKLLYLGGAVLLGVIALFVFMACSTWRFQCRCAFWSGR